MSYFNTKSKTIDFLCYKNQQICDKSIDNYSHTLEFVPGFYKYQKMYNRAVGTQPSTKQFVLECNEPKEICYKAVNIYSLYLILFLINMKLKKYVTQLFFISFFNSILPW